MASAASRALPLWSSTEQLSSEQLHQLNLASSGAQHAGRGEPPLPAPEEPEQVDSETAAKEAADEATENPKRSARACPR